VVATVRPTRRTQMNAQDLNKKLLLPIGLKNAEKDLSLLSKDSPHRAEYEQKLTELRARWESEAPIRALRAKASAAGYIQSKYEEGAWVKRDGGGRRVKYSAEQVVAEVA
jgi:hypothetical protein